MIQLNLGILVNLVDLVMLSISVKLLMIINQSRIPCLLKGVGVEWMPGWLKSSHFVKHNLLEYNC